VAVVILVLLDLSFGERLKDRSPTERAGLPPQVDVQARVEGSAEKHSPSLEQVAH
jgi:hypothetical protein